MAKYDDNLLNEEKGYIFNQRISWAKKKAYDFRWAEKCSDYIDKVYSCYGDENRTKRLNMNYNLFNGIGEQAMKEYGSQTPDVLAEEGIIGGYEDIPHHPIIDQVAKAMVGEQQLRPLNPIAFDTSGYNLNQRKRKKLELAQQYLNQNIIDPIRQQISEQYAMEHGVQDPYALSPEQQQQMMAEVEQRTKAMTPKEIEEYMRKDYKSPSETQAQKIVDFVMDYCDIKYLTDEGFKHAIITGEEIYRTGVRHNKPFVELVDPYGFFTIARPNSFFIEEGIVWKYEQYVMYNDIYNWHGHEIENNKALRDQLDNYARGIIDNRPGAPPPQLVAEVSRGNEYIVDASPDLRTNEGQEYIRSVFSSISATHNKGGDIRYVHTAWKGLRKLKYITQYNRDLDKTRTFWVDESYTLNENRQRDGFQDIGESISWVPELWQTTKVGNTESIYFEKEPIPYQYRSIHDPWDIKGPYIGAYYSKLMNNAPNVAPLDLGKPWQYKANIQMAKIHELESTDLGKIMLASFNAKPKNWSWGKFLMMIKMGKIAPVDLQQEGVTPMDSQVFKQMDLSSVTDLAARLQYLEFCKNQIALSMSYNPSRLGMQAPQVAVTNNRQNIIQSSFQTNDIYNIHNKVVENLLNVMVNVTRVAFKDNQPIKSYVLDDMSIAELDLDWEMLDRSEIGIKIRNSSKDFENIQNIKQLLQPMVQNGLISVSEIIRMMWAENGAEILNIAENAEEKMQQKQQEAQAQQQEMLAAQAQQQQELEQLRQQFELLKQGREHEMRIAEATIESTRFAQQHDIDQNNENDRLQLEAMKQEHDLEKMKLEHNLKMQQLKQQDKLETRRLKLEEQKIRKELELKAKQLSQKSSTTSNSK